MNEGKKVTGTYSPRRSGDLWGNMIWSKKKRVDLVGGDNTKKRRSKSVKAGERRQ